MDVILVMLGMTGLSKVLGEKKAACAVLAMAAAANFLLLGGIGYALIAA